MAARVRKGNGGQTEAVLIRQVREGLRDVKLPLGFAIAYEPVWAIGTGKAASGPMANEAIGLIRSQVAALFGEERGQSLRVLYGGSVTPENIAEFIAEPEIDGALVGGACLKADSFASSSISPGALTNSISSPRCGFSMRTTVGFRAAIILPLISQPRPEITTNVTMTAIATIYDFFTSGPFIEK